MTIFSDILLIGPPGAGKGTQAQRIEDEYGFSQISTGDMLRQAIACNSKLGQEVKPIVERGDLVPDELIVRVIRERLESKEAKRGFILDGFPRTIAQAEALDQMLKEIGRSLHAVFEFSLDEDEAVERLVGRGFDEGRADDNPEVIRHRFTVWREQTLPLTEYYKQSGKLVVVDAAQSVDEVYVSIKRHLHLPEDPS